MRAMFGAGITACGTICVASQQAAITSLLT
jgi:hypothetical protein